MLGRVATDNIQSVLPIWVESFSAANQKARGRLLNTLRAYANAALNVLTTAKDLSVHPNTIYARMQKIQDITGRNALCYHDLSELLLASECSAQSAELKPL